MDQTHSFARPMPSMPVAGRKICVLGAGMVGVCAALELQSRGARVTLIDRRAPGKETSWGNAGVLARSSLVPLNNPGLWRNLLGLASNRSTALHYDWRFLVQNASWIAGYLSHCTYKHLTATSAALDGLIRLSLSSHQRMIADCGLEAHLSDKGWLMLYRSDTAYRRAGVSRQAMADAGVDTAQLSAGDLQDLEPGLNPIFRRALWIRDAWSIDNPGALITGYARLFVARGGALLQSQISGLSETDDGVTVTLENAELADFDQAIVCVGPWARAFLERQGYRVRMAFERGYHRHYQGVGTGSRNARLARPIHDTGGGYVLAPMQQGLRLTTGVELCAQDAAPNHRQLRQAEAAARQAIDLGDPIEETIWLGSRPTFPDSRPAIGPLPGSRATWVSFGHQHIGFSTGPGSARVLADMMEGRPTPIRSEPFRPDRFIQVR